MKLVLSLFVAFVAISIQAQDKKVIDPEVAPVMTFEETVFDWGIIKEGEKKEFDFNFTNTGKTDLIITKIKGSCGCTVPSNWEKEPIKPGAKSSFHVTFNSRNKPNKQQKTITITCNTASGRERVKIKGMVTPDPAMVKMRAERAAKRKEQYAKRKLEREKIQKEKLTTNKNNPYSIKEKAQKIDKTKKQEIKVVEKKRKNSVKSLEKATKKSEKELKRAEKSRKKELKLAEKKLKLSEKELKANEKARKREEKELKRKLKAEKKVQKNEEKARKNAAKAVKKKAKLQDKYNKALEAVDKAEAKLAKMQSKFDRLQLKGKLSPEDVNKRKEKMLKQTQNINKVKAKLEKAKRKI